MMDSYARMSQRLLRQIEDFDNQAIVLQRMIQRAEDAEERLATLKAGMDLGRMSRAPLDGTYMTVAIDVAYIDGRWVDAGDNEVNVAYADGWRSAFPEGKS